jgi:hypothetical protein
VSATLEWLGTATFRLKIGGLTLFLDTYMDRVPAAPPVGLSAAEVTEADFILVGHSHFDHLGGADVIAKATGARIIGSHETCRVMRERGLPDEQLLASSGGERHGLAEGVSVRVLPSMHACTWILTDPASGEEEHGHTRLTQEERARQPGLVQGITALVGSGSEDGRTIIQHLQSCAGSLSDGEPLVYLIETPNGRAWRRTPRYWPPPAGRTWTASRSRAPWRSSSRWRHGCSAPAASSSATTTTGCRP